VGMRHDKSERRNVNNKGDRKRLREWKRGTRDEAGGEMLHGRVNEEGRGAFDKEFALAETYVRLTDSDLPKTKERGKTTWSSIDVVCRTLRCSDERSSEPSLFRPALPRASSRLTSSGVVGASTLHHWGRSERNNVDSILSRRDRVYRWAGRHAPCKRYRISCDALYDAGTSKRACAGNRVKLCRNEGR